MCGPGCSASRWGELTELARKIVAQFGAEERAAALERLGAHGVAGDFKNLIFAANGPKPRIALRDAINNVIEIVPAEYCPAGDAGGDSRCVPWPGSQMAAGCHLAWSGKVAVA